MKHKRAPRAIPPTARIAGGEHEQSGSVGGLDRFSEAQASSLAGEEWRCKRASSRRGRPPRTSILEVSRKRRAADAARAAASSEAIRPPAPRRILMKKPVRRRSTASSLSRLPANPPRSGEPARRSPCWSPFRYSSLSRVSTRPPNPHLLTRRCLIRLRTRPVGAGYLIFHIFWILFLSARGEPSGGSWGSSSRRD